MSFAIAALLPVFLTIVLGAGLRTLQMVRDDQWAAVDHICYYILFPAIIVKEIAGANFAGLPVGRMALALILGVIVMSAVLLAVRRPLCALLALDGPRYSSLFQGATRWHTFIALAIVPPLFGNGALALAAIAAAAMTPLLNVINVAVLGIYAAGRPPGAAIPAPGDRPQSFRALLRDRHSLPGARNSFAENHPRNAGYHRQGRAGPGPAGSWRGIAFHELRATGATLALATVLKLIAMPLLVYAFTEILSVSGTPQHVAVICAAVPTGSGAYVLAKQMGGDAPLVASILTLQVIVAALTLPLITMLLGI